MEGTSFKKKVDDFRISQKFFEDWRYKDESIIKEKIIDKVSTLLY